MMNGEIKFWKKEPRPPARDLRAWSLLIPAIASAVGFFAFAVLAYSFTEINLLPGWFRVGLVIVGAFSLAVGGEIGTLTTTVEIYRKHARGAARRWDWIGLVVSLCATLGEFLVAFATLLGVRATWAEPVQLWGPVVLGLLSALDSYTNFMEFGFYLAEYDTRYERWLRQYERWVKGEYFSSDDESASISAKSDESASTPPQPAQLRRATRDDWRSIYANLDDERADLTAARVNELLAERGFAPKADSTARDWAREARLSAGNGHRAAEATRKATA